MTAGFMVALRGYDRAEVDRILAQAAQALASADPQLRSAVRHDLQTARFRERLRGYARHQVDLRIEQLVQELSTDRELGPTWT